MSEETRTLVLDGNFLAWRAARSTGGLSHKGTGTGIIYGFIRDLLNLQRQFATKRIVFCFDEEGSKEREKIYPGYKQKRKEKEKTLTEDQKKLFGRVRKQIGTLRDEILPYIGFSNVYYQSGFEGDDIIASVVQSVDKAVIVSGDRDLYQLIGPKVVVWNPKADKERKAITLTRFQEELGIQPINWIQVKAIAGCSSDDVPGVPGVGEKTAIKFLRKEFIKNAKIYGDIQKRIKGTQYQINLELVRIPFPGTPSYKVVKDELDRERLKKILNRLGMGSLLSQV